MILKTLWVTLTSTPGLHTTHLWFILFYCWTIIILFHLLILSFFLLFYFFKDSYDQDLSSLEHSGGIISFILFYIFFSVCLIYIYCSQDPTTNSELVLKFRIRRFGISCWIRWARYLFIGTAFLLESVQDFLIKLEMKPCLHLVEISIFSLNHVIVRLTKIMNKPWNISKFVLKIGWIFPK